MGDPNRTTPETLATDTQVQNNSRNREEKPRVVQVVTDHIFLELLERLPGKSLSRFKSVSKQWKSMIESSYLAKKRIVRYPNPKLLVLRSEISTDRYSITILLETVSKGHHDHSKILIHTSHLDYNDNKLGGIMGYCNGLVCFYDLGHIFLINPATRKVRTLSPKFLRAYTSRPGLSCELPISVGFGRDIVTGAYKVILMYLFDPNITLVKAEVFNLNNGERKCIRYFPILYCQLCNDKLSIFANGSLYWLRTSGYRNTINRSLGAIDLHTEEFRDVSLPSCYTEYSKSLFLWSLRDRLCLSNVLQYPNVDVWGLKQEDPSVNWEKIHSINILNMDSLDANFWKLGLAACYIRPINKPSKDFLEPVSDEHCSTVLYTENLVSSV